jgi:hypothetical protein
MRGVATTNRDTFFVDQKRFCPLRAAVNTQIHDSLSRSQAFMDESRSDFFLYEK